MKLIAFLSLIGLCLSFSVAGPASAQKPPALPRQVRALLASRCLECHSGLKPKGGLDLSQEKSFRKGGESGAAVVAGQPGKSLLWSRVADGEMPPKHPLSKKEREILRRWISAGAKWQGGAIDFLQYTTDKRAGYDWWALQKLASAQPPTVKKEAWVRNDIDRFVLHRLEKANLGPAPVADPRALIRRLYIDLIGLPPSPAEVAAFVAHPSEKNYQAVVERLLKSPRYGERWGRHWLDVVRFGESDGFERNNPRKNFWHYRDWVIKALNDDMPYDRFVRMQLAGDLLEPGPEGAAAVGFLVAGVHNTVVGGSKRMKLLARQDELEEIVAAVGQTFLGLTVNCARCHDHKFDPIRNTEYYQMIASLDGVQHGEKDLPRRDLAGEIAATKKVLTQLQTDLAQVDSEIRKQILARRKRNDKKEKSGEVPRPYAQWNFEGDFKDSIGKLHGTPIGNARVENGALVLDGKQAYLRTAPLDKDLREKTLEAWVVLDNLQQRGGAPISVETNNGVVFDAIVFGERESGRWMAGSNGFVRTKSFGGTAETTANKSPVHFAIVYRQDGSITGYRNGLAYGKSYRTGFQTYQAGKAHVAFGIRHLPAGSNKMLAGRVLRASLYDRALTPAAVAASAGVENEFVSEKSLLAAMSPQQRSQRAEQQQRRTALTEKLKKLEAAAQTKMYTVVARSPGVMRVHVRGSVTNYGPEVIPGGVKAVTGVNSKFGIGKNAADAERRKRLADWITSSQNSLFARVIVNRVWHYHFGAGIVDTPNDLGFNGGRPSHPQLVDWLAQRFKTDGMRLKALHRLIVSSATYRQSTRPNEQAKQKDAQNRLLWRRSPHRVEAEVLRDAMLDVAGVLNLEQGGPGFEDVKITPNNGTTYYEPYDPAGKAYHRRTIYRFAPRGGRSAVLDTFDCPDPSSAAPRRSVTTTPLQALSLLNNAFVLRMSDEFAKRVQQEAGAKLADQITLAWQLALARAPDREEAALSSRLAKKHGLAALCRGLFNSNEFVIIE